MQPRIDSPAQTVPGALQALVELGNATQYAAVPATTHYLLQLRASQINGCSICVDMHSRELKAAGEPDARINTVAAWRDAVLHRRRARRARADRGRNPARRPP
jgi:AhpD family alkylhydroperoxidase